MWNLKCDTMTHSINIRCLQSRKNSQQPDFFCQYLNCKNNFQIDSNFHTMATNPPKFIFLKHCRNYLENVNLCRNKPIRIGCVRISNWLISIGCIFLQTYASLVMMKFCIQSGLNLATISSEFGVSIGILQLSFIYVTLTTERTLIYQTFECIQQLVDYSMQYA